MTLYFLLHSFTDIKYLMINGNSDYDENVIKMEAFDESRNITSVCASSSHQYPLDILYATGALVDQKVVICGGRENKVPYPKTSSCYKFSHDHQWKFLGNMSTPRYSHAAIPIPNGLWVTGGYDDGDNDLKSTEIILTNGTLLDGQAPLPEPRAGHCLLQYKNTSFLIGGREGNRGDRQSTVWIFKDMKYIGDGPSMNFVRSFFGCGMYHSASHNGNPIIVVAGNNGDDGDTSEFWDFTVPGSKWTRTSKQFTFLHFFKSFQ